MKKGNNLCLESVVLKQEIIDEDDLDFGLASNIIIEVVEPLSQSIVPLNINVNTVSQNDPPWVSYFSVRFDEYHGIVNTLHDVQEVVNCLEASTKSRFSVIKTRRKGFGCTEFNPNGIKIYWGDDCVPYVILNKKLLDCQHGKYRRPLPKEGHKVKEASVVQRRKGSKKLGCPAQIFVREILRYPDFKVSENTNWRHKMQSKALKKAFLRAEDEVIAHRCFVLNLPKVEHHENHLIEPLETDFNVILPRIAKKKKNPRRVQEPVHPKIVQKIKDLTCEGISGTKHIKEQLTDFIREELSHEEDNISVENRRFNPRDQDIRNVVRKVQTDLRKNGSSLAEVQCCSLLKDLGTIVESTKDEKYLEQFKLHLENLKSLVKLKAPLDQMNSGYVKSLEAVIPSKKLKPVEEEVLSYATYAISDADNDNQMLYEDAFPVKEEATHTVYYYE